MLVTRPCVSRCDWAPTKAPAATSPATGERLFACRGCGSQWVAGERWTPRQADGSVPAGIEEERQRQRGTRGRG